MPKPKNTLAAILNECATLSEAKIHVKMWLENKREEIKTLKIKNAKHRVEIKVKSINECWQGKRFKTPEYKKYWSDLSFLLPKISIPKPPYCVFIEFGFSSLLSDIDNPVKPIFDVMQEKYGINDRDIYELHLTKKIVQKGKEYFDFKIDTSKFLNF